ncbi:FAD-linked oxidase C-terminal domain-containing protein [Paraburkholderia tropica]|uniref:FAD-linked oxidase C-terminal domain-containing protein n=1 Tax=Paraburkholderia tropica TaxID=92647 RepID=UPI0032B60BFB
MSEGNASLIVEFGAFDKAVAMEFAQRAAAFAPELSGTPSARLVDDAALMKRLWSARETAASATSIGDDMSKPDPVVGWEDAAVEPRHLGAYLREFSALVELYGYKTSVYGRFGDG